MIFCGDSVFPFNTSKDLLCLPYDFRSKPKIVNLEALILEDKNETKTTEGIALNNNKKVIDFLQSINVNAVSLSNNHITDFDVSIDEQIQTLERGDIKAFGAGDDLAQAKKPFVYEENDQQFVVVSFGWNVIGCKYATSTTKGVNPMEHKEVFSQVESLNEDYPSANIILTFHNNYEFELYPQPAHRQMFFDLIDVGVKAIFCHHPHIVGGYEIHNNCPIFYSLGNFYLPESNYNGYDLKYPEIAKEGLCVEYNGNIENTLLYWTYKYENNVLSLNCQESLATSKKMKELSSFSGLSHKEYIKWFKKNRRKKKLLPIYKNHNSTSERCINNLIVINRQKVVDFLVRKGVK